MNTKLVEGQFGHGAIKKVIDLRDHTPKNLGMAPIPFDWTVGFDIEAKLGYPLKTKNQGQSFSCGGQAMSYYLEVLEALRTKSFEERSAKYIYSQVFYPAGGTDIRSIGNMGVRKGDCVESLYSSYEGGNPPSEAFMRDKTGFTSQLDQNAMLSKGMGYAFPKLDIDTVAANIRDNNGMVIMIYAQNNGTWLSAYPIAPTKNEWQHFLYAGKTRVVNGIKYIGVKNSWGNVGEDGWQYLSEDYFKVGAILDGIVLYDSSVYQPNQSIPATAANWWQRFVNWFFNSYTKVTV